MEGHHAWTSSCCQGFQYPYPYHSPPVPPPPPPPPPLPQQQQQHNSCCQQQHHFHSHYYPNYHIPQPLLPVVDPTVSSADQTGALEAKVARLEAALSSKIAKLDEAEQAIAAMNELIVYDKDDHVHTPSDGDDRLDLTRGHWLRGGAQLGKLKNHKANAHQFAHPLQPMKADEQSQTSSESASSFEQPTQPKENDYVTTRDASQYRYLFADDSSMPAKPGRNKNARDQTAGVTAKLPAHILQNKNDLMSLNNPEEHRCKLPAPLVPNICAADDGNKYRGHNQGMATPSKKSQSAPRSNSKQCGKQVKSNPSVDFYGDIPPLDSHGATSSVNLAGVSGVSGVFGDHKNKNELRGSPWLVEPGYSNLPTSIKNKTQEDPCYDPVRDDGSKNFMRGVLVSNLSPQTCVEELDALATSRGYVLFTKLMPTTKMKIRIHGRYMLLESMTAYIVFELESSAEQFAFDSLQDDYVKSFTIRGNRIKVTHIDTPTYPAGIPPRGASTQSWGLISRYVKFEQPGKMDCGEFEHYLVTACNGLDLFPWILRRETCNDKHRGVFVYMEFASVQIADYVVKLINNSPHLKQSWTSARLVKSIPTIKPGSKGAKDVYLTPKIQDKIHEQERFHEQDLTDTEEQGREEKPEHGREEQKECGQVMGQQQEQENGQTSKKRKPFTNRLNRPYSKANNYGRDIDCPGRDPDHIDYDEDKKNLFEYEGDDNHGEGHQRVRSGGETVSHYNALLDYSENVLDYGN